jgi:uncharacterized protein (DUF362 family)
LTGHLTKEEIIGKKHKVLIMHCDDYDSDKISGIIKEGMEELKVRPAGRILLKPNVLITHPEILLYAFTRKEFLDGVVTAAKDKAENIRKIAVGKRSGITLPKRWTFNLMIAIRKFFRL